MTFNMAIGTVFIERFEMVVEVQTIPTKVAAYSLTNSCASVYMESIAFTTCTFQLMQTDMAYGEVLYIKF